MAGFKAGGDDDVLGEINVTPLVDVVLVLLIIFIVTASAIVKSAIAVDLPKASSGQSLTRPPLSIIVSCAEKQEVDGEQGCKPGLVLVDGEPIVDLQSEDASIDPLLKSIRLAVEEAKEREEEVAEAERRGLSVLITADKDLKFQNVIWLMDVLKNEGVAAIMFNSELFTRPEEQRRLPE